jgi:hypothetical protein
MRVLRHLRVPGHQSFPASRYTARNPPFTVSSRREARSGGICGCFPQTGITYALISTSGLPVTRQKPRRTLKASVDRRRRFMTDLLQRDRLSRRPSAAPRQLLAEIQQKTFVW